MWEGGRVRSYLLRVQLEDRPGSLGSLAVALGTGLALPLHGLPSG